VKISVFIEVPYR